MCDFNIKDPFYCEHICIPAGRCLIWDGSLRGTHLCPPEDTFHIYCPRLCPPCSSTSLWWSGSAEGARSPWTLTWSGSTGPAQVQTLTEDATRQVSFMTAIWSKTLCLGVKPLTHQHNESSPRKTRTCRNIWSCPECWGILRSDRRPAGSTRWCLQCWEERSDKWRLYTNKW